jgi:hypothetical protein
MNDNISNTSIYNSDDYEYIQLAYEEMTRRDKDDKVIVEIEDDTYEVNFEETCIDLCDAGFVMVNGRCIKRY